MHVEQELVLSFYHWVLGIELRSAGLALITLKPVIHLAGPSCFTFFINIIIRLVCVT